MLPFYRADCGARQGCWAPNRFREFVHLRCRPLIVAIGMAGETACPTLLNQSFGEVGGAGGFACQWKLISIGHPNSENGYAPTLAWLNQLRLGVESLNRFLYASL